MKRVRRAKLTRRKWRYCEEYILRYMFPIYRTEVIADMFNRSYGSVAQHAAALGLSKSEAFLKSEQSGRVSKLMKKGWEYRFPKGNEPWNKGKPFNAGGRSVETRFKKGDYRPVKEFYLHKDKNGKLYKWVRVSAGKRRPLHQIVWEQNRGPIPKGCVVCFRDGDTMNCDISNLFVITKAENMARNSLQRYPEEVKSTIRTLAKLKRTIKTYEQEN